MTASTSEKAKLFLLKPDFEDAAYPEQRFFCRHCALVEGVLASFPKLLDRIEVNRVGFPRPRQDVIELIGSENQSLPVLVLADNQKSRQASGAANGRTFVSGSDAIIAALSELYGIPVPHP